MEAVRATRVGRCLALLLVAAALASSGCMAVAAGLAGGVAGAAGYTYYKNKTDHGHGTVTTVSASENGR